MGDGTIKGAQIIGGSGLGLGQTMMQAVVAVQLGKAMSNIAKGAEQAMSGSGDTPWQLAYSRDRARKGYRYNSGTKTEWFPPGTMALLNLATNQSWPEPRRKKPRNSFAYATNWRDRRKRRYFFYRH